MADPTGLSAICPFAASVTCYHRDNYEPHYIAQGCRRWNCNVCGPRRKAALAHRITTGRPNRMITLTCRHEKTPQYQLELLRSSIRPLVAHVRKRYGEFEYVRVLEQCKDSYPHFHLLARSAFIPRTDLVNVWREHTGAHVVDIRKAHGRSVRYVAKYIGKAIDATGKFSRQRISVTRKFWPPLDGVSDYFLFDHDRTHPHDFVPVRYADYTLARVRTCVYHVTDREPGDDLPLELVPQPEPEPDQCIIPPVTF